MRNYKNDSKEPVSIVMGRSAEMRIRHPKTMSILQSANIPYGSHLFVKANQEITKGTLICEWDPYNAVILSEVSGKIEFEDIIENVTFREESDEQTGYHDKVIIESRQKARNPLLKIMDSSKKN